MRKGKNEIINWGTRLLALLGLMVPLSLSAQTDDAGVTSLTSPVTGCSLSNAENVTVVVENFGSGTINTFDVSYRINTGTPVTETVNTTIAPGGTYTYTFTSAANLSTPGAYTIKAYTTLAGDASAANDTVIVNVTSYAPSAAGTITGTTTICAGTATTLTLTGYTGSIQWQSSTDNVTFSNITGATASTYNTGNLSSAMYYRAVVTNGSCTAATSAAAAITVNPAAVAGTVTPATANVCAGNSTAVSLGTTVGTIQWYESTDNVTYTAITGATAASYTTPALTSGIHYYGAIVTNGSCIDSTDNVATITVVPAAVAGTISGNTTVCSGTGTTLTLSGYTGTIQWEESADNITFTAITGAAAAAYTTGNLTATRYYRAVVTNGSCTATTAAITVTVNPAAVAGTATPATASVCAGNSTTVSLGTTVGTIQWYESTDNVTYTAITGETSSSYTTPALTSGIHYYGAIVTNGSCIDSTDNIATITVVPAAVAGTISGNTTVCSGTGTTLTLSGYTGTIQWEESADNVTFTAITGATAATYATGNLTATHYYRAVVTNGSCTDQTAATTVTVNPAAVAGLISPVASSLCAGNTITVSLSAPVGNVQWYQATTPPAYAPITGANAASYTSGALSAGTYYFGAIVTNGTCTDTTDNAAIITVAPAAVAGTISGNTTVCSGTGTTLTLSGYTGTIQWEESADNVTFTAITGATAATYATGNLTATRYYRAVVTNGSCSDQTAATTVTVNPAAVAGPVTPATANVCAGNSTTVSLGTTVGTIQWYESTDNVTYTAITGATAASYTTPALTSGIHYYGAIVTNGSCIDSTDNVATITVVPAAVAGTISGNTTVCSGTGTTLTLSGYTGTIQWEESADNVTFTAITGATAATYATGNLTAAHYYRAVVTNGSCTDQAAAITVNVSPAAVAGSVTPAVANICEGSNTTVTLGTISGNIQWYVSIDNVTYTAIAGATSSSYTSGALTAGTYYYGAIVTSGACIDSTDNVATITVAPAAVAGTISGTTTVCSGTGTTLTLSGYTGTIQWEESADNVTFTAIAGETSAAYTTPNLTVGMYYRAVVTNGSCNDVTSAVTVTVDPLSVAGSTSVANPVICAGTGTTITLTGYTGAIQWQESTDNVTFTNISGATSATLSTGNLTATMYYQAVVTSGTCASDASHVETVTVNPLPVVTLGSFNTVCVTDLPFALTGASPAGGTYSGTGVSGSMFDPSAAGAGTFTITYTYSDGTCSNTASSPITVDVCVGIEEAAADNITVMPNPSEGVFNVVIANAGIAQLNIDIIDMKGQLVYSNVEKNIAGEYSKQINITDLAKGVYYLRLNTGEKMITKKLVIQ